MNYLALWLLKIASRNVFVSKLSIFFTENAEKVVVLRLLSTPWKGEMCFKMWMAGVGSFLWSSKRHMIKLSLSSSSSSYLRNNKKNYLTGFDSFCGYYLFTSC